MNFETISFTKENNIGTLTFNRPKALNALNKQMISELGAWVEQVKGDTDLRAIVFTGEGKSFIAGADIKEMKDYNKEQAHDMAVTGQKLFNQIESLPFVTIAAVNGFALGGGLELAMSCDLLVASEKAKIGLPEVTLGLIPGYGGTQRLSRYVGKATARFVTLTGDIYSAAQAYEWGLFAKLFSFESFPEDVEKLAKTVSSRGPVAQNLAKKSINLGYDHAFQASLKIESDLFAETFVSEDHNEGIAAFIEKRAPNFQGK